ncbi:MAG: hypothetical protein M0R80_01990 [Proteobacteria bacterium]|jgi:hypothetical protein|nr:hypothetical protein [Pseudomonadota bacterium]
MTDITGNDLCVVIECENKPIYSWMGFVSWYSVVKNLPNAEVIVVCKRSKDEPSKECFTWARRANIQFFFYENSYNLKTDKKIVIKINSHVVVLREYDPQLLGPVDAKSDVLATFIDYSGGCGKFVMSEWINREVGLIQDVSKFASSEMSINEMKLLNLWEKSYQLYANLEGGIK